MCIAVYLTSQLFSFQVGTLDTLVGLSDDLGKLDTFVEGYVFLSIFVNCRC